MTRPDLGRLLRPRGIAFVGASEDTARYGGRALRYALDAGFAGAIAAVNPKYPSLFGRPCHPTLDAVPEAIDVAVALVGPQRIPALMAECRVKGVGFLVVVGAVAEADAARLRAEARDVGPRIVGPMSVGVVVPPARAAMAISSGLLDGPPRAGRVAVVSQSGGILGAVIDRARASRVGFSALVSSGQELDLGTVDYVAALLDDEATRVVAAYFEDLDDWPGFLDLARAARARGKTVLALVAGRTTAGEAAALSHSGRVAGNAQVVAAALARHGAVAIADIDDLHVTAGALAGNGVAPGTGLAVVSLSGGYAVVLGDLLSDAGVPLAGLGEATIERLRGVNARPANPLDAAGRGEPGDEAENLRLALEAFDADPAVGAVLYGETAFLDPASAVPVLVGHARKSKKPLAVCWQSGPGIGAILGALNDGGVVAVDTPDRIARTLRALWDRAAWREVPPAETTTPAFDLAALPAGLVAEPTARRLVAAYGLNLVAQRDVPAGGDVGAAALGFPAVLKGIVPGVAHKTEHGLVRLGLGGADEVRAAAAAMAAANPALQGFVVQASATGLEFLLGVKNDARLGAAVVLGFGGVLAEAMDARAVALAPLDRAEVAAMIERVDRHRLLDGWRGSPPLAREALVRAMLALGRLAWEQRERLAELDLNPIVVTPTAALVVDIAVVLR